MLGGRFDGLVEFQLVTTGYNQSQAKEVGTGQIKRREKVDVVKATDEEYQWTPQRVWCEKKHTRSLSFGSIG